MNTIVFDEHYTREYFIDMVVETVFMHNTLKYVFPTLTVFNYSSIIIINV